MQPLKPLGHKVLVQMIPAKFVSKGGIILATETEQSRERKGAQIGKVISFGPTAYVGFDGCEKPSDWGVHEGDIVELSGRYDGKETAIVEFDKAYSDLRVINDSDIIAVLSDEIANQLISEVK